MKIMGGIASALCLVILSMAGVHLWNKSVFDSADYLLLLTIFGVIFGILTKKPALQDEHQGQGHER